MRIAIQGCSHGALDSIYASIRALDARAKRRTDLVLLCGDFQALRNVADLDTIAVPDKYKQLGDFVHYYTGFKKADYLTIVIGGNHEASAYMWELFHGGWLAPNIYFLGAAGSVEVGGLNISGISGIYKSHDYKAGRHERLPYDRSTVRSTYHTRQYDVMRLGLLSPKVSPDLFLSHDWPNTIEQHGDVAWLKRKKPFFTDEIVSSTLGSPPLMGLLQRLRPEYWFAAHLHVRFAAMYKHNGEATKVQHGDAGAREDVDAQGSTAADQGDGYSEKTEAMEALDEEVDESADRKAEVAEGEQIEIDLSDEEAPPVLDETAIDEAPPRQPKAAAAFADAAPLASTLAPDDVYGSKTTRFLALSKCLKGQDFLQILDVAAPFDTNDAFAMSVPMHGQPAPASSASTSASELASGTGTEDVHHAPNVGSSTVQENVPSDASQRLPTFRYVPRWLAITRATHSLLSLSATQQPALPRGLSDDAQLQQLVDSEEQWVQEHLMSGAQGEQETRGLDEHPLAVARVQLFVKTAPGIDVPEGARVGPPPWYSNPQTQALCDLLQIPNKINPAPHAALAPPLPPPTQGSTSLRPDVLLARPPVQAGQAQQDLMRMGTLQSVQPEDQTRATRATLQAPGSGVNEEEEERREIERIQEAARAAMKRKVV